MNIQSVNQNPYSMIKPLNNEAAFEVKKNDEFPNAKPKGNKLNFVDKFSENIKNSADLDDTVNVPRTIFKGYLAFTLGTSLGAISGLLKKGKAKNVLGALASVTSILGTWFFVRPYVIKNSQKKQ